MKSKPYIRLGDATTHGGSVIEGDLTFTADGKPIARIGDMTFCPKCKGNFPIISGNNREINMGRAVARHGDKTACGAELIASQLNWQSPDYGFEGDGDAGQAALEEAAASKSVAIPSDGGICLDCLIKAAASGSATITRG
ncbi:PAAR domain-containing protein [Chitinimonas sp. PSY-7]|uniref:PAAR domain-containing protein n=1 Tax=Chitinimonas sp. PSY-7 TaxID=3459088 RepID=UPI0040401C61